MVLKTFIFFEYSKPIKLYNPTNLYAAFKRLCDNILTLL